MNIPSKSGRWLIMVLMIGFLKSPTQASAPERSLRGNRDIPTRNIANGLAPRVWKELRSQEYDIYFNVLVEAQSGGSVRFEKILQKDPASISEEVARKLIDEVELFYPRIGNRLPRHGEVHLILYRHTSYGPLALVYAEGINVPEHVTTVAPFLKIVSLAPLNPEPSPETHASD